MKKPVWLVGAGAMAAEYSKVLRAIEVDHVVVGRGAESAARFRRQTGQEVFVGGLSEFLQTRSETAESAIVAVNVHHLADVTERLITSGVRRLLVEKPLALTLKSVEHLSSLAQQHETEVYVAYNRRFYSSVDAARKLMEEDGGATSLHFEFTEWRSVVEALSGISRIEKERWFIANSTHVADLAFALCGEPADISCYASGGLDWHPTGSAFSGAGITNRGVIFSYQANWTGPGRWGVEVVTRQRRYIFRPLEKLQVQPTGSLQAEFVPLDDELDRLFKPGLYRQIQAFLSGPHDLLCTIKEHEMRFPLYMRIANYTESAAKSHGQV